MVGVCVASFFFGGLKFEFVKKSVVKSRTSELQAQWTSLVVRGALISAAIGGSVVLTCFPPPFPGAVAVVLFCFGILHRPIVSLMKTRNQRAARLWQRVPASAIQAGFWVYYGTPWRRGGWVDKKMHSPAGRSHAAVH